MSMNKGVFYLLAIIVIILAWWGGVLTNSDAVITTVKKNMPNGQIAGAPTSETAPLAPSQ